MTPTTYFQLGDALMRRNEYEQAVRIYGRLAKMPNIETERVEALQAAAKRMYDQQQAQLKKFVKLDQLRVTSDE